MKSLLCKSTHDGFLKHMQIVNTYIAYKINCDNINSISSKFNIYITQLHACVLRVSTLYSL